MASRTGEDSRFARRIFWLAAAIVAVVLGYTAFWFSMARGLERELAATVAELNGGGVRAHCEEPEARGYPFRIGLFCRSVFYENVKSGVSVRAGAFRSTANVYQPYHVVGEVDAPAALMLPLLVPLEIRWSNLRASTRLADPLPEHFSLEGTRVTIAEQESNGILLVDIEALEAHARSQGEHIEAAVSYRDLRLGAEIAPDLPPLEGRALVLLEDGVALAGAGRFEPYGRSAVIRELVIGIAGREAQLSVSGPVSVGADGLIDAELSVRVRDPGAVMEFAAQIFPEARDGLMTAAGALGGLGDSPLPLRITRGQVFLGFIPLGRIPPV